MQTLHDLSYALIRLSKAQVAGSFFVNGPRGAGKTNMLHGLTRMMPKLVRNCYVMGPYAQRPIDIAELSAQMATDFVQAGFIDKLDGQASDFLNVWEQLGTKGQFPNCQSIIILIDVGPVQQSELEALANLFSAVRYLEAVWTSRKASVLNVLAGTWMHSDLERHYQEIGVSFPYTVGYNYARWLGIDFDAVSVMYEASGFELPSFIGAELLCQIAQGHAAATEEILTEMNPTQMSVSGMMSAARHVALDGQSAAALVTSWQGLPKASQAILQKLLLVPRLPVRSANEPGIDPLITLGAARIEEHSGKRCIRPYSWFAEMVLRMHAEALGIDKDGVRKIRSSDLVPDVGVLELQAYKMIRSIENAIRNALVAGLSQNTPEEKRLLEGRGRRNVNGEFEDAHLRANEWRAKLEKRGLSTQNNPDIAFCSTRELGDMALDFGRDEEFVSWTEVGHGVKELADIRDMVMHNQLIDESMLLRISTLQDEIYARLAEWAGDQLMPNEAWG